MAIKKSFKRITKELSHNSSKWESLFKVTHFDRILAKQLQNENNNFTKDLKLAEGMIKSYMLAHVKKIKSQRDVESLITGNKNLQQITGFNNDIPVQSTFSRHWNDPEYVEVLDKIFLDLIKLIGLKKVHLEYEMPSHLLKFFNASYLPLSTDATFIKLSDKKFDYSSQGYSGNDQIIDFGAKINLMIDALLNMPFNYIPTAGNIHETKSIDVLIDDLLKNSHPWLSKLNDMPLKPLLILDKGYWNKKRFVEWNKHQIAFIVPRKKKSLVGNLIEFLQFPCSKYEPLDGLVWLDPEEDPIRWIVYKNHTTEEKYWDLLTSVFEIDARTIIAGQRERWPIEELFKWVKQNLDIKKPLSTSWVGFVIHCFIIFILLLLLQYFLSLLSIPRWQENLTELCRQLREHPETLWSFHKLRIPLGFLNGGDY